jgi:hypothetical protein
VSSTPSSSSVHDATGSHLPSVVLSRQATPAERRAAAVTVAHYSTDVDDCRDLLAMLGLLDEMPAAS